jgi:predicted metal-dependent enzyme (double-stranded beta helix superfamily)
MTPTSLDSFITAARSAWTCDASSKTDICRAALAKLSAASLAEHWLAELHAEMPATRELHRDSHGFMLLAHAESEGLYRPPHDHGRAWVVYAVQSGQLEVSTYKKVEGPDGRITLAERERSVLQPGEARSYLVGEVHDTRCLSKTALLFRFTERDLRHEDQVEGKVTRFVTEGGRWTSPRQ